ncbi:MAG: hypothetical protein WCV82_04475 [Candidatus Paceibacterota bacterium]
MKPTDIDYVRSKIDNEGFDYTFEGYSEFKDISDEEFHTLRESYLAARKALADYLGVD